MGDPYRLSDVGTGEQVDALLAEYGYGAGLLTNETDGLLAALVQELQAQRLYSGGPANVGAFLREQEQAAATDDASQSAQYSSTGPESVTVTNTEEWRRIDLDLLARTVNIRTTGPLELTFNDPESGADIVSIGTDESPFSIGGPVGIDTPYLWVRQAETASQPPEIKVLAYK